MKYLFKIALLILLALLSRSGQAKSLTETLLTTPDKQCGIHYWTDINTDGWYLRPIAGSCPNGLLEGPGRVTVRNREDHVVHSLDGAFIQGYPIGPRMIPYPLLGGFVDRENMVLTFDLGQDDETDTHFFGRLTLLNLADYPFSSQKLQPLRILMRVKRENAFYSEESQRRLIAEAIKRGKVLSAQAVHLYLFGTVKSDPTDRDILFFAEADLPLNQVKVKRRPKPNKDGSTIPYPKEIRPEAGVPVVRVLPSVSDRPESPSPAPTSDIQGNISLSEDFTSPVIKNVAEDKNDSKTDDPVVSSDPTEVVLPNIKSERSPKKLSGPGMALDKIPHLLTSARLLQQPVQGKARVHISRFDGAGRVVIDQPVPLSAKGNGLSLGWGIVEGYFSNTSDPRLPDTLGFIDITSFSPIEEGVFTP